MAEAADFWDAEFRKGRFADAEPLGFTKGSSRRPRRPVCGRGCT